MGILSWLFSSPDKKGEYYYRKRLKEINGKSNSNLYDMNPNASKTANDAILYLVDNCRVTSTQIKGYNAVVTFDDAIRVTFWNVNRFYGYASSIKIESIHGNQQMLFRGSALGISYESKYKLYEIEGNNTNAHIEREVLEDTVPLIGTTCSNCGHGPVHLFEDKRPVCQSCGARAGKTTFTDIGSLVVSLGYKESEKLVNKLKEILE